MELVTLEAVRAHCYASGAHDDAILGTYTDAAEQYVQDFLNRRVFADVDSMAAAVLDGTAGCDPMVVNPAIRAAVLLMAGHLYRNREAVTAENAKELPLGVTQLLWPARVGLGV